MHYHPGRHVALENKDGANSPAFKFCSLPVALTRSPWRGLQLHGGACRSLQVELSGLVAACLLALLALLGKKVLIQVIALLACHDAAGVHETGEVAEQGQHKADPELQAATEAPKYSKRWQEICADARAELIAIAASHRDGKGARQM